MKISSKALHNQSIITKNGVFLQLLIFAFHQLFLIIFCVIRLSIKAIENEEEANITINIIYFNYNMNNQLS